MTKAYIVEVCGHCPLCRDIGCGHPDALEELTTVAAFDQDYGSEEKVPQGCPLRNEAYWVELSWRLRKDRTVEPVEDDPLNPSGPIHDDGPSPEEAENDE